MPHIYALEDARLARPAVVTIGVFDGVHRGHQTLIRQLVTEAHTAQHEAVVMTFFPHPDVVLRGKTGRYYLTTPEQRAELLLGLGVDWVITHPFDEQVRLMRAATFVDRLVAHARMVSLWVGVDFALGYQREGNVAFLTEQGATKGFEVKTINLVAHEADETVLTSTSIRNALQAGDVAAARDGLGRSYSVYGEIVHGQQRGRTIGFPTANVAAWAEQVLPANGVYACWVQIEGEPELYKAVTNIGVRPTFDGQGVTVEAHLLDFDRDIYGKVMTVTFETRLRAEKKFNGIEELIAQIRADAETGRAYLAAQS